MRGPKKGAELPGALPESARQLLAAAQARIGEGRPDLAANFARQALQIEPGHPDATYLLGVCLLGARQFAEAASVLGTACAQQPRFALAQVNLGSALEALGRLDEAAVAYRRSTALDPSLAGAHYNLGGVLQDMGQNDEAAAAYRRALTLRPDIAEAHFNLAGILHRQGRLGEAESAYRETLNLKPDLPQALTNLGTVLVELGRFEEAIGLHRRAIEVAARFAGAHANLGNALREAGQHEPAVAAYRQALALDPQSAETYTNMGGSLRALGEAEAAIAAHRQAIALRPAFPEAHVNLAIVHMEHRDYAAALEACQTYLAREAGNPRVLAVKAVVLHELGRRDEARHLLDVDRLVQVERMEAPPGYDSLGAFNEALSAHILAHPTLVFAPTSHATRAGRHTGELLSEPKGPVAELESFINRSVEAYIAARPRDAGHPLLAAPPERWRLTVWSVVMEAQGHQVPHIHPAWLSGVYYPKVPPIVTAGAEAHAGWIGFGRPGTQIPYENEPEIRLFKPEEGMMILFPSYFYHHTVPYEAEEQRISIAFDVLPI